MIGPILIHKLKSSAVIILFLTLTGSSYELLSDGYVSIYGPTIGFFLGVILAAFEEFIFPKRMRTQSFTGSVITKTAVYIAIITVIFLSFAALDGLVFLDYEWADFMPVVIYNPETYKKIGFTACVYLITIFFMQLNKLLGPGVLLKFIGGRYHTPKIEQRVFMFLDLKSSTSIAENLGHHGYYSFLNDFIRDITDSVITTSAQIYQYVGDEIVLTWKTQKGIENSNCLHVFYSIQDRIEEVKEHYLSKYQTVPEFKAGAHCGEVISAEIGDLKKDIVYNGDVLNTTSRIQGLCNQLDSPLLISSELSQLMVPTEEFQSKSMGSIELKGKAAPMELISISRNGRSASAA